MVSDIIFLIMAEKHNWQSQIVGRNVREHSGGRRRDNRNRNSWRFQLDIEVGDKNRLQDTMKQELTYYNNLVSNFDSIVRTSTDILLQFGEEHDKLFADLALIRFDINTLINKGSTSELPESLEKYRKLLLEKDEAGTRNMTERMSIIMEVAGSLGSIYPAMRKNMAAEVLKFYKDQAKIRLQAVPLGQRNELMYRTTPAALETHDRTKKRHVQLTKPCTKISWDEKEGKSFIKTPYTMEPLVVREVNLTKETQWNIMVIHQEAGNIPIPSTPWYVELKSVPVAYLTKYIDVTNPYAISGFHEGKGKRKR